MLSFKSYQLHVYMELCDIHCILFLQASKRYLTVARLIKEYEDTLYMQWIEISTANLPGLLKKPLLVKPDQVVESPSLSREISRVSSRLDQPVPLPSCKICTCTKTCTCIMYYMYFTVYTCTCVNLTAFVVCVFLFWFLLHSKKL